MKLITKLFLTIPVLLLAVFGLTATSTAPKQPTPTGRFESFSAEPNPLCVNTISPLVRVNFSANSSTNQCVSVQVNGNAIIGDINPNIEPGLTGFSRCGQGTWERNFTFSLSSVFGNNIPSTVAISAQLVHGNLLAEKIITANALVNVSTRVCQPSTLTPARQ